MRRKGWELAAFIRDCCGTAVRFNWRRRRRLRGAAPITRLKAQAGGRQTEVDAHQVGGAGVRGAHNLLHFLGDLREGRQGAGVCVAGGAGRIAKAAMRLCPTQRWARQTAAALSLAWAVRAVMSGACWPSKTNSTFCTASPKVFFTLHSLEVKTGAEWYLEVKLAGVLVKTMEGSVQFSSCGAAAVVMGGEGARRGEGRGTGLSKPPGTLTIPRRPPGSLPAPSPPPPPAHPPHPAHPPPPAHHPPSP